MFMDVVGHIKTFQNIAPWLLLLNSYKIIAPIVRSACYYYSSETLRNKNLELFTIVFSKISGFFNLFIVKGSEASL